MRGRVWLPLLCLALMAGQASGDSHGTLLVSDLAVPQDAELSLQPLALWSNDTEALESLVLTAPSLRVHLFERRDMEVHTEPVSYAEPGPLEVTSFTLTDVEIRLDGALHDGWMGVYPRGGDLLLRTLGEAQIAASEPRTVGNERTPPTPETQRTKPSYGVAVPVAHGRVMARGELEYVGGGTLKLLGPDVLIHARENETPVQTGVSRASDMPLTERTYRWAYVEFDQATLVARATTPWEVATERLDATWSGTALLSVLGGNATVGDDVYQGRPGRAGISGDLRARVTTEPGDPAALRVALDGVVTGSTLQTSSAPLRWGAGEESTGAALPLSLLALGIAMGGAGVAGTLYLRHRGRPPARDPTFTPDQLMQFAALAAENERFAEAVEWTQKARELAPGSSRLLMDEAFFLSQQGLVEAAMARYREAAALTQDGEADFAIAELLRESGGAPEEIERHLVRALERSPELALELEAFASEVVDGPRVWRAMRDAYRRLERR